ncbi:winged helix-turn-helix domain-containing protein [Halobacillus litoralis]|uniref:ArsR/SmtB family transcription factor n=1 Tax=Halobacillus litoralis TaxID=45668 RepID=UPI001CD54EEA|nr:winged helix-turn-helix domain-containing protein [Halobacillus litoralis]MCA0970204.1 winged helix-turn-helix domain-containing protein [Halobacillus litoralis]
MEVINTSSLNRETYEISLQYSLVFEAALGIAAVTNDSLIQTLEEPWQGKRSTFSEPLQHQLDHVQTYNTWKALLQLAHAAKSTTIEEWQTFVQGLSDNHLKQHCLPFMRKMERQVYDLAALGEEAAIEELYLRAEGHPFYPGYIQYVVDADAGELKRGLLEVMTLWWDEVIVPEQDELSSVLKRDFETKSQMSDRMHPEEFVKWATQGREYLPEPSVLTVLLIPHVSYRPWNVEADLPHTKVIYYPVAKESLEPDGEEPQDQLVRPLKALGDGKRLLILKKLNDQPQTLKDLTHDLEMGKTTIHHHLKTMKAARVIKQDGAVYAVNWSVLSQIQANLEQYLKGVR